MNPVVNCSAGGRSSALCGARVECKSATVLVARVRRAHMQLAELDVHILDGKLAAQHAQALELHPVQVAVQIPLEERRNVSF